MTVHLLADDDLTREELLGLVAEASALKKQTPDPILAGKKIAMLFEKPSTRTRVSFECAIVNLGGHPLVLRGDELQLGRGETIQDTARVLSSYVDAIVMRTFGQDRLEELANAASVSVVNALSDSFHPCQAVADLLTMTEKQGRLGGLTLAFVGDGNNVANSLLLSGANAGLTIKVAAPRGREPAASVVEAATALASASGGSVAVNGDPHKAVAGADVVYTDVWRSMGRDDEGGIDAMFAGFCVDEELVSLAGPEAIVMHCLPAHRGEEIAASVIDGPRSVVWDQAANRVPAQMAILARLLG